MRYRRHFARWRAAPLLLLATLAVTALSACGTRGNPPALGKPVQVTLSASGNATTLGQATLTPAYGAQAGVSMQGALVPYSDPQTPAQLREGSCYGKVVAPLTSNAPAGDSAVVVQGGSDKGANVALPVDANWYVVVLESAAPNAAVTACGHPLNNMRQYFDLYEPDKVDQGVGLGIALYEGIVITQVHVALAAPSSKQPAQWSIHSGGCQGSTLASGAIASGATTGSGIAFAPLDAKTWWLAVATDGAADPTTCVKAG